MLTKEVNPKGGKLTLVTHIPTDERLEQQAKDLMTDIPEAYSNRTLQEMKIHLLKEYLQETWSNDIYVIMVYRREAADELVHNPEFKSKCTWLSIRRRDRRPVNNWQDMQTIKNRLYFSKNFSINTFSSLIE